MSSTVQPKSVIIRRLVLCGLLCSPPGWAGPPLVTDDPGLAGAGMLEAILAVAVQHRPGEEAVEFPQFDLTYGLGERLDLLAVATYVESRFDDGPSPEALPLAAGVKWQPWGSQGPLLVSTAPVFEVDARDTGSRAAFLPVQVEGAAGSWQIGGEVGYAAVHAAPDAWQAGIYAARPLAAGSVLLAEIWMAEVPDTNEREVGWTAGAEIALSNAFGLLVSVGSGISSYGIPRIDNQFYIGLKRTVSFR